MSFTAGLSRIAGSCARRARKLQARLLEMVEIEVRVAEGVDELAGLQPGHLRHHHGEQRVGRDVERHAEENVGRALVELAGQPAARRRRTGTGSGTAAAPSCRRRPDSRRSRSAAANPDCGGSSRPRRRSGRWPRRPAPATSAIAGRRPGRARRARPPIRPRSRTPCSCRYLTLVSPARNQSSSWTIDFRCSFLVVVSGKPSPRSKRI